MVFTVRLYVCFPGCSKDNRVSFNKKVMASFKKEMARLSGKKGKFEIWFYVILICPMPARLASNVDLFEWGVLVKAQKWLCIIQ